MATALPVVAHHRLPVPLQGPFFLLFRGRITPAFMAPVPLTQSPTLETASFMRTAKLDLSHLKIRLSSLESANQTSTARGQVLCQVRSFRGLSRRRSVEHAQRVAVSPASLILEATISAEQTSFSARLR